MDNTQFKHYLEERRAAVVEQLKGHPDPALKEQVEMLDSAIKIMTYGTGPARRRFRRDYERRAGL